MQKINVTNFCLILSLAILSCISIFTFLLAIVGESHAANDSQCKEGGPTGNIEVDEINLLGKPTGKKIPAPSETYTICGKCQNVQYVCQSFSCRDESQHGFFDDNGVRIARKFITYKPIKLGTCVEVPSKKDKCSKCRLQNNKGLTLPACHTEDIYQVKLGVNYSGDDYCNKWKPGVKHLGMSYNYNMSNVSNCFEK